MEVKKEKMVEKAILLIEFQNDFLKEDGAMKDTGIWKRAKEHKVVENTIKVVESAREADVPIIHAQIRFRAGYPEISEPFGLVKGIVSAGAFRRETPGVEIIEELKPKTNDFVLDKRRLSAFCDTELESLLRNLGVKELILAGFITNWCIEQTGRDAYDRSFKPIFLIDCMEALSDEEQNFAIEKIFPAIGEVRASEELIEEFEKRA